MFQESLGTVREDISTIRAAILTNEKLRNILFQENASEKNFDISSLRDLSPKKVEWRIYDHCAVVTRLYAIYETFVEDLIRTWVAYLPQIFLKYSELPDPIQNNYEIGTAKILQELTKKDKSRIQHLSREKIIRILFHEITNDENKYELIPEAFLFHEQNLWPNILENMFSNAGISETWKWLKEHRTIKNFIADIGDSNTPEGQLKQLITYRNEAAHRANIDDFLASESLLKLCDFIEALCQALTELVSFQIIKHQEIKGKARKIGQITNWFKHHNVAAVKLEQATLFVDCNIFLVNERRCQFAKIKTIRDKDNINHSSVKAVSESEFSVECSNTTGNTKLILNGEKICLEFDVEAKKNLDLYLLDL